MRVVAVIQARMSSQRLPGKILRDLAGKPMLQWVLESVATASAVDDIVLATSDQASDDPVCEYCAAAGWMVVRGPLDDVRARFLLAAETMGADVLVRICGDSPLMDHRVIDRAVTEFRCGEWDMVTNALERTFPRGLSVEVFSIALLRRAIAEGEAAADREHVTPWFYRNREHLRIHNIVHDPNLGEQRLVVDTAEDFEAMERLVEALDRSHTEYSLEEIAKMKGGLDPELETSR